jgi:two-component system cell cycle response regulator
VTDWDSDTNVTHETEVPSPSTTVRDRASLVVLAGPRVGTLVRIEGRELIIGRSLRAELCVDDDGVSRHHARIRPGDGGIWIEDLESRNGTFVNGVKVTTPVRLEDGDKIHVGRSSIVKFTYHDALDDSFQERVVVSALRDPLTRLYNKRYFDERLDAELRFAHRHGSQLALLMIDVDHFKRVNDQRGHLVGDTVLTSVAQALARAIRNEDVAARFGGEEFVVILRATGLDQALLLGRAPAAQDRGAAHRDRRRPAAAGDRVDRRRRAQPGRRHRRRAGRGGGSRAVRGQASRPQPRRGRGVGVGGGGGGGAALDARAVGVVHRPERHRDRVARRRRCRWSSAARQVGGVDRRAAGVDHRQADRAAEGVAVAAGADVADRRSSRQTTSAWNSSGSGSSTRSCTSRGVSGPAALRASTASLPRKPPGLPRSTAKPRPASSGPSVLSMSWP